MRFPPEFIDRLRSQVRVSDVVGRRVSLKRHGKEFQGLCPFHKEKTPSFTVNDAKGFYHCFGCGAHGDAIRFLTEHDGMRYPDAIEQLANEVGLALPEVSPQQMEAIKRSASLQEVMESACRWYEQQLKSPAGKEAVQYLKERGLTGQTAKTFRMGYAPDERDALKSYLASQGVTEAQMVEAGLAIRPDRGAIYDRFRGRVMFPIRDRHGRVIAFGGRILPSLTQQGGREAPKYLNSPETPLFRKGEVLYNYELARHPAHKVGTVLVTEGYMDVIALHQSGIAYAVAPLGTAVTEGHLRLLWQLADEPVLCLDGDAAGQRAMARAAELSLPLLKPGKSLRFLMLPKGEDPDTLVRSQGREVFEGLLANSLPLSDALWEQYAGDLQGKGPERKAAVENMLMKLVENIQDVTVRSHFKAYFKSCLWPARKGGKGAEAGSQLRSRDLERFMQEGEHAQLRRWEREVLRLIVQHPALLDNGEVEEQFGSFAFSDPRYGALSQLLFSQWMEVGGFDKAQLEEKANAQNLGRELAALYTREIPQTAAATEAYADHEAKALSQWQALVSEHTLVQMQLECRQLETELAETMSDESYNRLVELKKQIAEAQQERVRLQVADGM